MYVKCPICEKVFHICLFKKIAKDTLQCPECEHTFEIKE